MNPFIRNASSKALGSLQASDFHVTSLGPCRVDAGEVPGLKNLGIRDYWMEADWRIPYSHEFKAGEAVDASLSFEKAGPFSKIYFDPTQLKAGIVTCGGLCPGLNVVIRSLVMELWHIYGVRHILGYRRGYRGLNPAFGLEPVQLTPDLVSDIHDKGGTILGTSRGAQDPKVMVETLKQQGVQVLFAVGGDGTQKGAHAIWETAKAMDYPLVVMGVPKTIDNDISFVYKTFGMDTAVELARDALDAAHTEAKAHPNGIGLVKLFGRDSGFIAAFATLASVNVNFTLVPEVGFDLNGEGALLDRLEQRLAAREHALIVVAEGAAADLLGRATAETDPSGNLKYEDVGIFLRDEIKAHFKRKKIEINLKYIDPSYMVRSMPANANDTIFAGNLARCAVHGAMAGKTDALVGVWYNQFVYVPLPLVNRAPKKIDPKGQLWLSVLQATGQPAELRGK